MRRCTLLLILSVIVLFSCNSRKESAQSTEPKPRATTQIESLTDTLHDFGIYKEREDIYHDFLYRNIGKIPFVIDSVKTNCGCTNAKYVKRAVLPGQTDTIRVIYGGNGFSPGFFYQTVVAYCNADKDIILRIKGIFDHVPTE